MAGEAEVFLLLILAFIIPPCAVFAAVGCGADLCLNILLTCLAWLPGCIHAIWLILRRSEANKRYGYGNWTYVGMGEYFPRGQAPPGAWPGQEPAPPPLPPASAPTTAQYATDKQSPPSQVPVEQKQAWNAPVSSTGYPGPPPELPAGKQDEYVQPPAPADQK